MIKIMSNIVVTDAAIFAITALLMPISYKYAKGKIFQFNSNMLMVSLLIALIFISLMGIGLLVKAS